MISTSRHSVAALLLFAAISMEGCDCEGPQTRTSNGEIGVIFLEDNVSKTSRNAVYDFGSVFMGQSQVLKLEVKNLGPGLLNIVSLEKESGSPVTIGTTLLEEKSVFEVKFEARDVPSSELTQFEMVFMPPQDSSQNIVDYETKLILRGANTPTGEDTAEIILKGRAISGVCELPKVIDFGAVARGDTAEYALELKNPTALAATAFVGDIYGGDALAFGFTPDSPRGSINLPSNTAKTTTFQFTPTEIKKYEAYVRMRASAQCPEYPVTLKGDGVDSVLTWEPNPMDFKYATPGYELTQDLTFKNAGRTTIELSDMKVISSAEFRIMADPGVDATKLSIPGQSETKVRIGFKPSLLGPRSAVLRALTTLAKQSLIEVQLKGFGGGPNILVTPSPTLNFGKIAYFAGATPPSFQKRKLTVMNVGTADPNANLKLMTKTGTTDYWDIVPLNADSSLSEIEIAKPSTTGTNSYNPAVGLEANPGKNKVDLEITVTPNSASNVGVTKSWQVTLYSNDPDQPETKITVTADSVSLPPCNYSVTPLALNFGLVTPPQYRDLTFNIKNEGLNPNDVCLLSNLDLTPSSDKIYSLPAGPIASKELQPQETIKITVRTWPQTLVGGTVTNAVGQVRFYMSSPTQPEKLVTLQTAVAASCLTITPSDLDFGTVQKGCNSATRTFNIYNTCPSASPVTIKNFSLQAAAGQPAGGPDCPGTSPCPEFFLVSTPATPVQIGSGGAPITFTAKYRPLDMGADSGAIAINATQNSQNVTYIITLQGKGDTVGINTDVFTQDAKPKADILLTIDNSGSMQDEQAALASNFEAFIRYAIAASVDYQIGVITTDNVIAPGKLVSGVSHPAKVLTPTTSDVEGQFKAKVNVGTNGSAEEMCFEPSLKALTYPTITTENAGLLRTDAALAIVCVSDELEQSPQSVQYYYNQLLNVKGIKNANLFTVSAIAGFFTTPPSGCNAVADDLRYATMVADTNGVKESICTADWSKSLEQLGKTAFGFRTNFFLNATPDLSGGQVIKVEIDNVEIPNVDSRNSTVWTYDPVANSINFEPMFVPEPGQTLSITYQVACY